MLPASRSGNTSTLARPATLLSALNFLLATVSFSMVGVCTALAIGGGSNALTIVALRTLGTLVIFLAYFRFARVALRLSRRDRLLATAVAVPLCINTYCINEAISEMPVPLAVLIFYLWPAIVTTASWALGTERFRLRVLAGLAAVFLGIALALNADLSA